jgi:hypothetical protein
MAAGEAIGLLLTMTYAGVPDTTGQTVLTKGPGGPSFSKKRWRKLMALLAAEDAAKQKASEEPAVEEVLQPAIEAAEGIVAAAPLIDDDDIPDLGEVIRD